MATILPIKTLHLKASDQTMIKEMIEVYISAHASSDPNSHNPPLDPSNIPLGHTDLMASTISNRINKPAWEFILAINPSSNLILGWLALVFAHTPLTRLSEEHILFAQYILLPNIVVKARTLEIPTSAIQTAAHTLFSSFKSARESHLPSKKHSIISALVVRPEYQHQGVASALLAKAHARCEVAQYPIWVAAPGGCEALFLHHRFSEVGTYTLDLDAMAPEGKGKGKGKGKGAPAAVVLYVWKYMICQEPLTQEILAYQSSTHFAALEAERVAAAGAEAAGVEGGPEIEGMGEERQGKGKGATWGEGFLGQVSKAFTKYAAVSKLTESQSIGGDKEFVSGERRVTQKSAKATANVEEGAGPSTPLLTKASSSRDNKK